MQRAGKQQPSSPPGYTNQQGMPQQGMTPQGRKYGMSNKPIPSMMGQGGGQNQQGLIQALRGKMGQGGPMGGMRPPMPQGGPPQGMMSPGRQRY